MGKNPSVDIKNPSKGTAGTNRTYDQNQGNREKQMNVNYPNNANSSQISLKNNLYYFQNKIEFFIFID